MKYLLLFILFICACKIPPKTDCYICTQRDSVSSNIPKLAKPHYYQQDFELCELTKEDTLAYVRKHTYTDTIFYRNDTIVMHNYSAVCEGNGY